MENAPTDNLSCPLKTQAIPIVFKGEGVGDVRRQLSSLGPLGEYSQSLFSQLGFVFGGDDGGAPQHLKSFHHD